MLTWSCVGAGGGRQSIESPPRTSFPCVLVHKVLVRLGDDHGAALSLPELPLDGVGSSSCCALPRQRAMSFTWRILGLLAPTRVCWRLPGSTHVLRDPAIVSWWTEPCPMSVDFLDKSRYLVRNTRDQILLALRNAERKWKVKNVLSGCVSFPLNITDVHSSLVHTTEKICNGV